jgi:hypothetical protein
MHSIWSLNGCDTKLMTALLEKNAKFVWFEKCQANFEELKKRLTTTPVLVLSDLSKHSLSTVMHLIWVWDVFLYKKVELWHMHRDN